jgi:hypothetical protein
MGNSPEPAAATLDLDALERLAKAATPGPWIACDDPWNGKPLIYAGERSQMYTGSVIRLETPEYHSEQGYECSDADLAFIVAVNPATILELCRRLRAAGDGPLPSDDEIRQMARVSASDHGYDPAARADATEPNVIFLSPQCADEPHYGRTWCTEPEQECLCGRGCKPVRYNLDRRQRKSVR